MLENIVICCRSCNEDKGALDAEEYAAWKAEIASRLDRGWWDKVKVKLKLPSIPYRVYAEQRERIAFGNVMANPTVVAILTTFPGSEIIKVTTR